MPERSCPVAEATYWPSMDVADIDRAVGALHAALA
jgi:hypothetical protein